MTSIHAALLPLKLVHLIPLPIKLTHVVEVPLYEAQGAVDKRQPFPVVRQPERKESHC